METKQCDRRQPHHSHGWVEPALLVGDNVAIGVPPFLQCPGVAEVSTQIHVGEAQARIAATDAHSRIHEPGVVIASPERADREGDSQALPTPNDQIDTQTVAIQLIQQRRELGIKRYGVALQPNNNRDSMWDLVEELLDAYLYTLNHWRETHPGQDLPG